MSEKIENIKNKRLLWIDCAKYVAIIAVAIDHTNGFLYDNKTLAFASYFSVSLFILLSGLSSVISSSNKFKGFQHQFKKVMKLFISYSIATLILFIYYRRFFDLKQYIDTLLNFNIQGPYYFLVFYFQLALITPLLVYWFKLCNKSKYKILWHTITMFIILYLSSLFIRYTFILPVHGGGRFLFGGTYLVLYYFGMLLSPINTMPFFKKNIFLLFIISCVSWIIWLVLMTNNMIIIDSILSPIFGFGFNPPSFNFSMFAILTLFVLFSLFNCLENLKFKSVKLVLYSFSNLGQYTLYIFMYHLLVKDIILSILPEITNIWLIRLLVFIPMITFPALFIIILNQVKSFIFSTSTV